VVLVDQEGRERRLYSDLLQGRVVVINLFFTSCEDSCPILTRNLVKVQDLLGPRLGPEVAMLSFSVDPEADTPERCKAFAAAHAARPGWYFLTGSRENVDTALAPRASITIRGRCSRRCRGCRRRRRACRCVTAS
jgi:protein SCO1/2